MFANQTLEIRRTIPVFDAIEGQVKVEDILWLSTLQIALSYVLIGEDAEEAQASIFIASLPPAKDQTKTPSFRNYEDPCYGKLCLVNGCSRILLVDCETLLIEY